MQKLLIIAGFARCGTTWLHNRLAKHSHIKPALGHVKEIGYFEYAHRAELNAMSGKEAWGDRIDRANKARFPTLMRRFGKLEARVAHMPEEKAVPLRQHMCDIVDFMDNFGESDDWYRRLFSTGSDEWAIDSTPSYSRLPNTAIGHIAAAADEVRVVLIVREPASRLRSVIQHNISSKNWLDHSSDRVVRMIKSWKNPYIDRIEAFRTHLKPGQLMTFFFEDLVRDRGVSAGALLEQLGLTREAQVFELEEAPNPSGELVFDGPALLALADQGEKVTAEMRNYLGAVPPEWNEAPASFRAQAAQLGGGDGLAAKAVALPAAGSELANKIDQLARAHRTTALLELLTQHLAQQADDKQLRLLRAQTLERLGRFDQALSDYRRACGGDRDDLVYKAAQARIARAVSELDDAKCNIKEGAAETAIATLQRMAQDNEITLAFLHLARARLLLGQKTEARMSISRFLCEQPDHELGIKVFKKAFS